MTQQEIQKLQEKIAKETRKASIETWCNAHGIDPSFVTYEDGKICIPVNF